MTRIQRSLNVVAAATRGVARAINPVSAAKRWPDQVNDWNGRAQSLSGIPVVLVPGSFVPGQFYWHRIAPVLISDGHPVFACNLPGWGTRGPDVMVAALETFVESVKRATGSGEVVLIGQSFGGVIIRDLLQRGPVNVPAAITISSQHNGFRRVWNILFSSSGIRQAVAVICPMALELVTGSDYLSKINSAGVRRSPLTTVTSVLDAFAPAASSAIPEATNIVLQEIDPSVRSGHMLIGYDPATIKVIRDVLANVR
ncbi:hypothetical protein AWB85_09010 [Mycobacteroides immunogenum]|uniref:AB hydrolase-1 domain-containing protein n=1 Tax=Mycobacteroides immunogenum TaxID=83262 RepID=A0A179V7U2_9MYCO|nr:alpha/beta fold hydrolase [Mycobacteroides immunogenum]OAT67998.1 hypothetical protein AWB85_09010 [Mycobacteroides immunogenum]